MAQLLLPTADRRVESFTIKAGIDPASVPPIQSDVRTVYAAAHVVVDPFVDNAPMVDGAIDWDRTLAFREHLWSLGFGVAEAIS